MATVAEILLARGRQAAEARRREGESSAQMWQTFGNTIGGALMNYAQQKEQEPIRAQNARIRELELGNLEAQAAGRAAATEADQRFSSFLQDWDGKPDSLMKGALSTYGEAGASKAENIWKGFQALKGDPQKEYRDTQTLLRDVLLGMNDLPETTRAQIYPNVRNGLVQRGVIKEEDAKPEYSSEEWNRIINFGQEPKAPVPVEGVGPQGQPQTQFVVPTPGMTVDKPAPKLTLQEEANAALKRGDTNEYQRVMRVIRDAAAAGRAPDRPNYEWALKPDGSVGLMTPDEIRAAGATKPPSGDVEAKNNQKAAAQRAVTAVRNLGSSIIKRVGPAQRADAIKRGAEAVFGNDPEFRAYQDARMALAGTLAVEQQGSRVSDADVKALWLPMVPDAYRDTAESNRMKWDLIDAMRGREPAAKGKPFVGERRKMGDQVGVWDGTGWVPE